MFTKDEALVMKRVLRFPNVPLYNAMKALEHTHQANGVHPFTKRGFRLKVGI